MKVILSILTPCLMIASSASAELAWVKSPFWQAPVNKNISLKIISIDKNLAHDCAEYRRLVAPTQGPSGLDADDVETLRNDTGSISFSSFYALFKVDTATSQDLLDAGLQEANKQTTLQSQADVLPYFTLPSAQLIPQNNPVQGASVVPQANSLVALSNSLGLKTGKVLVTGEGLGAQIKVYGKDTACDLIAGDAAVEFDSNATVKISFVDQTRSDEFYRGIENLTVNAFTKKSTSTGRAAWLGFHLGEALAPLQLDSDKTAAMVGTLVENLFDSNMQRNGLWNSFNGESHLMVSGSAATKVHIRLEK